MDYVEVVLSFEESVFGEILEAELAEIGFESFVNEQNTLKAYISVDNFVSSDLMAILTSYSDNVMDSKIQNIAHTNWNAVWEASYEPVLIENSIYIKAPFHKDHPTAEISITLDPNMSFGTGHHPTTHMMLKELSLIDLRNKNITGKDAEKALVKAEITVNKNMVPFDDKSPFVTSGIRVGTAAVTTRGLKEADMEIIVGLIDEVITNHENETMLESIAEKVNIMMKNKPLFV